MGSHLLLECVFAASLVYVTVIVNDRRAAMKRMARGATLVVRRRILPIHRHGRKGYRSGEERKCRDVIMDGVAFKSCG